MFSKMIRKLEKVEKAKVLGPQTPNHAEIQDSGWKIENIDLLCEGKPDFSKLTSYA